MSQSNARINQTELLLTLDYLLHYTDEHHPATQIDICEHATKFGLKFDKNNISGNQVKRQRISECLKFLEDICNQFPDSIPFVLEKTDSGKYYIEERNGLNENQVAKLLAAIKNDKFTKDEDTDFLIERVLDAFSSSEENRRIINDEYEKLIIDSKKYDKETLRRIRLIEKAYHEGKRIKIKIKVTKPNSKKIFKYYFWYRVYFIKEYRHRLYAFLLPVGQFEEKQKLNKNFILNQYLFGPIEKIEVDNDLEKNVLCSDEIEENRNFDELFQLNCPDLAKKYHTLDEMLERKILPNGGDVNIVSFYFELCDKDILRKSFKEFFSEEFRYQETYMVDGIENKIQDLSDILDNWLIAIDEPQNDKKKKYGLVNISVDNNSFKSWLLSDPFGDGNACVADMVTIIKPLSLNQELTEYFYYQLTKRTKYLPNNLRGYLVANINKKPFVGNKGGNNNE